MSRGDSDTGDVCKKSSLVKFEKSAILCRLHSVKGALGVQVDGIVPG